MKEYKSELAIISKDFSLGKRMKDKTFNVNQLSHS